ncbi:MAG: energy transducer TonB [Candidatus Acidiferrum sp.]
MTTMLADPPKRATRLGVGLDANRRQLPNADAWKSAIGTKPIAARLALLPDSKPRWDRIGVSAAFQLCLVIFCILIPLIYPDQLKTALHFQMVQLASPLTEVPVAPPPPPPKAVRAKAPPPKPEVVEPVKLDPKKPHIFEIPKAVVPKARKLEALAPDVQAHLEATKIDTTTDQPKRPREDVKLNNINSGSAAPATVKAPIDKVQTGGFGDPNGIPGKGDPNHATTVNRQGSPLLPGGPGYGNGTGGNKGIPGTVASSGFGNGVANPPAGAGRTGKVQSSGFGQQTVAEGPKKKAAAGGPIDTPVDILDKPKPEYTAEGRSLKLEGDVVIDMVFLSNGTVQVNRVISGLGHGLDEAAVRAAQQIKFKPAKREGQPVDFPARVRIEFRLAY